MTLCMCPSVPFYIVGYLRACASHLFTLPEHQVHEAAHESHREADPGQDVGGAVGAFPEIGQVETVLLSRVDRRCDHHT